MEVMYMLIAFSLLIASGFLVAFMWAVRSGQYDDRYTPSVRMLMDDIRPGKRTGKDANDEQTSAVHDESGPDGAAPKSIHLKKDQQNKITHTE